MNTSVNLIKRKARRRAEYLPVFKKTVRKPAIEIPYRYSLTDYVQISVLVAAGIGLMALTGNMITQLLYNLI